MSETTPGLLAAAYARGVLVGTAAAVDAIRRMVADGMALDQACAAVVRYARQAEIEQLERGDVERAAALLTGGHAPRVD